MKKFIILSLSICLLIFINSCSKENDFVNIENPYVQNPDVAENIVLITASNSQVVSSESDLANGVYTINFTGSVPAFVVTDIIIGDEGEGFLRKVTSVAVNGNTVTMQTTQANMEDVFRKATIEFTTDITKSSKNNTNTQQISINSLAKGVSISTNGLDYDFSNTILYQDGTLTFKITNGTATFDPSFSFKSNYGLTGLSYLDFRTNDANLAIDSDISLIANGAGISLPTFKKTLADYDTKLRFLVAGLPVIVVLNTQLVAELHASITSSIDITAGFTNNYMLKTGVKYENDIWSGNFGLIPTLTPKPVNLSDNVTIAQNLTITPRVSAKFYGVIGPYCEPKMTEDFVANITPSSLGWDAYLKVGLDITTGIDITIFGKNVADFSRTDKFEETIWSTSHTSGWYKGSYTLENVPYYPDNEFNLNNCGSQGGQVGDFYVFVSDINQDHQVVFNIPSILSGIPTIYQQGYLYSDLFQDPSQLPYYQGITQSYCEDLGPDPNYQNLDRTLAGLNKCFYLGTLKLSLDGNTLANNDPLTALAHISVPFGTGSDGCSGYQESHAFVYLLKNISANYVGSSPPSGLSAADLEIFNTILENDDISVILVE